MAKLKELIDVNGHVVIPAGTGKIAKYAFNGCSNLVSIDIAPDTTEILASAFKNCSSLKQIAIPEGVANIPENCFEGCSSLTSVLLPSSVKSIGTNAFKGCSKLTEIIIPEGISEIPDSTFEGCNSLAAVKLPSSIKKIGMNAFSGCKALINISLPEGLAEIGESSFKECAAMNCSFPKSLKSIGKEAFSFCGFTKINFHEVDAIGEYVFRDNNSLTEISWPATITKVSDGAFSNCKKLEKVFLPDNLVAIGKASFIRCELLQTLLLPESLVEIGDSAFYCAGINEINIPSSTTRIGTSAFANTKLTTILIPESVIEMGSSVFRDTPLYEVTMNAKIDVLPAYIFYKCKSLKTVNLPSCLKKISEKAFFGSGITKIDIPETVTEIEDEAFEETLISSIRIPESTKKIGRYLFSYCTNLVDIQLPKQLESIAENAFGGCSNICEISIPDSMTEIPRLFGGCTALNIRLSAKVKSFSTDNDWKTLTIDDANPYLAYRNDCLIDKVNNSVIWMGASCSAFPEGVIGIGKDRYSSWPSFDWYDQRKQQIPEVLDVEDLVIPEGITFLDYFPFEKMPKLKSLTLPGTIKSIQENFLEKCKAYTYFMPAELFINSSISCNAKLMSFNLTGVESIDDNLLEKIKEKCNQIKNGYVFFNGTLIYQSEKDYQKRWKEVYGQELVKAQKVEAARLEAEKEKIEDAAISAICSDILKVRNIPYYYISKEKIVKVCIFDSNYLCIKIGLLEEAQKTIEDLANISASLIDFISKSNFPVKSFKIEKNILFACKEANLYPILYNSSEAGFRVSAWFEEDYFFSENAATIINDFFSLLDDLSVKYKETLMKIPSVF